MPIILESVVFNVFTYISISTNQNRLLYLILRLMLG